MHMPRGGIWGRVRLVNRSVFGKVKVWFGTHYFPEKLIHTLPIVVLKGRHIIFGNFFFFFSFLVKAKGIRSCECNAIYRLLTVEKLTYWQGMASTYIMYFIQLNFLFLCWNHNKIRYFYLLFNKEINKYILF